MNWFNSLYSSSDVVLTLSPTVKIPLELLAFEAISKSAIFKWALKFWKYVDTCKSVITLKLYW